MTPSSAELVARLQEALDESEELDWSIVHADFEIHDHELMDSRLQRGREGWFRWSENWSQAFEDFSLERYWTVEVDERRVLTVHRLWARGRASGVELERTDAQLWTFSDDLLVRMDYYPDYREGDQPWSRAGTLSDLDEPVQRYFSHALGPSAGTELGHRVRLAMRGRIKVGLWLPFRADWEGGAREFVWRARVGRGVLRVVDRYAANSGGMDVRLFGRRPLVHTEDADTVRSAAGRAALEAATWAPASLLPGRGVAWRAEGDDLIVASWELPPERPEVRLRIDETGAPRTVSAMRWGKGDDGPGYIPCGAVVHAERSFGELVIPSRLTVGWWFDTPRWAPFFEVEIDSASTIKAPPPQPA